MSNNENLKPCPFCGGEAEIKKGCSFGGNFYFAKCKNCSSEGERKYGKIEAIEVWNKRTNSEKPNLNYTEKAYSSEEIETMRKKLEYYEADAGGASVSDLLAENKALWQYVHFCRNASANDIRKIHDKARDLLAEQKSGSLLTPNPNLTYADVEKMVKPLEWEQLTDPDDPTICAGVSVGKLDFLMREMIFEGSGGEKSVWAKINTSGGEGGSEIHALSRKNCKAWVQEWLVNLVAAALGVERSGK